ncbi:DUF3992 domain-containing protein [Sutcliffiella horikoshii]|uniref:S-Ena type endospore appendage n=1 Tax=Sutcliffiella horikoshii TaxID=79883 RepID=UPI00384D48A9
MGCRGCGTSSSDNVNDSVCMDLSRSRTIAVADPTPITDLSVFSTIYTDTTNFAINGTILVVNGSTSTGSVVVMVNENTATQYTVAPGESEARTFGNINSIQVAVTSFPLNQTGTYSAAFQISFTLNYKF